MHAVVDTNVLVSALLHADRLPAAVMGGIAVQQLMPLVCTAVMAEYAAALRRPRLRPDLDRVEEPLMLIEQHAVWVEVPAYSGSPDLPDPADWPFVA